MRALAAAAVVVGGSLLVWACSDEGGLSAGSPSVPADEAGPPPAPDVPETPLACETSPAGDPCGAARLTMEFVATGIDGGALDPALQPDAGPSAASDGGAVGADGGGCAASGAVRLTCPRKSDDSVVFDIAADDDARSQILAWRPGTLVTLDATGALAPPALARYGDDTRVFVRDGSPLIVSARGQDTSIGIASDSVESVRLDPPLDRDAPLRAAALAEDGTVYALVQAGSTQLVTLPKGAKGTDANVRQVTALDLAVDRASKPIFLGKSATALLVTRGDTTDAIEGQQFFPFAASTTAIEDLPVIVANNEGELIVFAALGNDAHDYAALRVHRSDPCKQDGCGYTCTEEAWVPSGMDSTFVRSASGEPLLVYLEAAVTQQRRYSKDGDIPCTVLGGCACPSKADITSVKETAVVVMGLARGPLRLVERARVRVAYDPKLPFYREDGNGKTHVRRLMASARGDLLHVGVQESDGVLTRVVIDLAR